MIRARNVDPASPIRYFAFPVAISSTSAVTNAVPIAAWPFEMKSPIGQGASLSTAKITDVISVQAYAGVGGTSQTVTILKNGTSIFTTAPVIALAGGANKSLDTNGTITAVPSGWTRGVLKTDSTVFLTHGDILSYTLAVSGSYSTAPNIMVVVAVDVGL